MLFFGLLPHGCHDLRREAEKTAFSDAEAISLGHPEAHARSVAIISLERFDLFQFYATKVYRHALSYGFAAVLGWNEMGFCLQYLLDIGPYPIICASWGVNKSECPIFFNNKRYQPPTSRKIIGILASSHICLA
jgi:hypothetical protein